MPEPLQIVPGKTDQDIASDIKQKLIAVYEELIKIADEANEHGLAFQCQIGLNAFGKFTMTQCQIIKVFK